MGLPHEFCILAEPSDIGRMGHWSVRVIGADNYRHLDVVNDAHV